MDFRQELSIASAAVREASVLCARVQASLVQTSHSKPDRSPVTIADYGSQSLICSRLKAAYPSDQIIAEESSAELRTEEKRDLRQKMVTEVQRLRPDAVEYDILDWIDSGSSKKANGRYWTLDPIDGTKGFLRRAQYAIALALIVDSQVVISVVGCPNMKYREYSDQTGVLFSARRGYGACVTSIEEMNNPVPISVSPIDTPDSVRFCESIESAHTSHSSAAKVADRMGIVKPPVRMDSQAKYALVGSGGAEIYMRLPAERRYIENIWDHAAGALLVQEAGGRVTDLRGDELIYGGTYQLSQNTGIVATNGRIHDRLLEAVGPIDTL